MTLKFISNIFFSIVLFSCNSHSNDKLLIGTWTSIGADSMNSARLIFLKNEIILAMPQAEYNDTISYKLSDNGKTLITTETRGKIETIDIIKLSETELILFRKKGNDTLRLKRE